MSNDRLGTREERVAVRCALIALDAFNKQVADCNRLGITCHLEPDGKRYVADFKKTTTILPASSDGE